jgi:hypothetical protein
MTVTINGSAGVTTNSGAVYDSLQRATAVTASGTSVDFTGIPSWVKRITVMFNGTSINAAGALIVQIGFTTFTTTGYSGAYGYYQNAGASYGLTLTNGFGAFVNQGASDVQVGSMILINMTGNTWISSMTGANAANSVFYNGSGAITLGGVLDRVRITTAAGTATFDAGTINIIYE